MLTLLAVQDTSRGESAGHRVIWETLGRHYVTKKKDSLASVLVQEMRYEVGTDCARNAL